MSLSPTSWKAFQALAQGTETICNYGRATQVIGLVIEGQGPRAAVGDICHIEAKEQGRRIPAEVVGFRDQKILLMPFGECQGIEPGCRIIPAGLPALAQVGEKLLGRVIDGLGNPIDGKGPVSIECQYPLYAQPVNPLLQAFALRRRAACGRLPERTCDKYQRNWHGCTFRPY